MYNKKRGGECLRMTILRKFVEDNDVEEALVAEDRLFTWQDG